MPTKIIINALINGYFIYWYMFPKQWVIQVHLFDTGFLFLCRENESFSFIVVIYTYGWHMLTETYKIVLSGGKKTAYRLKVEWKKKHRYE